MNTAMTATGMQGLAGLNPLSKIAAVLPAMVFVALTTDAWAPLAVAGLTLAVLLLFGNVSGGRLLRALAPAGLIVIGFLLFYPWVVRRELVAHTPVWFEAGRWVIHEGAVLLGLTAGLRIFAFVALTMIFNLTTDVHDFARALVQQARLPYRAGYAAMAALRFAPLLRNELDIIRAAHRLRGLGDAGGLRDRLDMFWRTAVPLLASAIRRAERAALAMDGRAFGAYPTRTDLRRITFTWRDAVFVAGFWLMLALIVIALWQLGLLGPLAFVQRV